MLARYRRGIALIPGARGLLRRLDAAGIPLAVASSSPRAWVDAGLEGAGLAGYARHSVSGDEVAAGKPDPGIYLEAARGLGAEPAECIAVEDAAAGVASARAAGMRVALVGGGEAPEADWRIDDLRGFDRPGVAPGAEALTGRCGAPQAGPMRLTASAPVAGSR